MVLLSVLALDLQNAALAPGLCSAAPHPTALQRPPRGRRAPPETSDPAFRWLSGALPARWGEVLDAGTGPDSLKWLAGAPATSITAVTACAGMHATVVDEVADFLDSSIDDVVVGNWQDGRLLRGRSFDVVLADYLLGSVDHFAPHFQVDLLRRLAGLVRPNGWLALVGREPEDLATQDATSQLIIDVDALRDAAMAFGRQRPYREMPQRWVQARLEALGFQVRQAQLFPRTVTREKLQSQLAWAAEELAKLPHAGLRASLQRHLAELRARAKVSPALGRGHPFGRDYALVVQRAAGR